MSIVDLVLIVLILSGVAYLLYRSIWKKKGGCPGCTSPQAGCSYKYPLDRTL
ncbi:MAG: FeoB-associated Cys-rich membrane protein [Proteobacteria bacterium]|nr:FeoB-associated Cys-rich membrane protein [Pseudomonadota bacterium]